MHESVFSLNNEISSKIEKCQNNKLYHFLYVFGVKESDATVILVIRGQLLPQRSHLQFLSKFHYLKYLFRPSGPKTSQRTAGGN